MIREVTARHEEAMARALDQARRAEGRTRPNPLVGCVIMRDGEILAEGYHAGAGHTHAEIDALEKLDGNAEGADVYVNLEPCCHYGRTPPCTDALLEAGVDRVFVGMTDPDPRVSGEGIRILREAGVEVVTGILEAESRRLNRAYVKFVSTGLPWVSVKYAMSLDGKIATRTGDSAWVTGEAARHRVHRLRDVYDAIMVGTGTLRADDPRLTSRVDGGRDPVRVLLDARLEVEPSANVYTGDSEADVLTCVGPGVSPERRAEFEAAGVEIVTVDVDDRGWLDLEQVLRALGARDIMSLFVEGGGALVGSLFDRRLVDRVYGFVAPKIIGGVEAPGPVQGRGIRNMKEVFEFKGVEWEMVDGDLLVVGDVSDTHRAFPQEQRLSSETAGAEPAE